MSPPSRTFSPVSISSGCHHDSHEINDKTHDDTINIDQGQYELEKIDAAASSPSAAAVSFSPTPGALSRTPASIIRYARCVTQPSPYKYSLPHHRLLRSFPRLPHAFVQPSPHRYTPYIPISVTPHDKILLDKRNSISEVAEERKQHKQLHRLTGCSITPGCTKPTRSLLSDLSTDISSEGCDTEAALPTTTVTSLDHQRRITIVPKEMQTECDAEIR